MAHQPFVKLLKIDGAKGSVNKKLAVLIDGANAYHW